jgi:hypothetical protein
MLGQGDNAAHLVTEATEQLTGRVDSDDRAACHARLSLCLSKLGRDIESRAQFEAAKRHRAEFATFQLMHKSKIVSIAEGN